MERFSIRQQKIITLLSDNKSHIAGKSIGHHLNISIRTVQTEIANINNIENIIKSDNKGYIVFQEKIKNLSPIILTKDDTDEGDFNYSLLAKELFFPTNTTNIYDITEKFFISISTLDRYLHKILIDLEDFDLSLERNNNSVIIIGNESNKQKYIRSLIIKETTPNFAIEEIIDNYLSSLDITIINKLVYDTLEEHNYFVDNFYSETMLLNIYIALYRMKSNNNVRDITLNKNISPHKELNIALDICKKYSSIYDFTIQDEDIFHMASLLSGLIKPLDYVDDLSINRYLSPDFIQKVKIMIDNTLNFFYLDIELQDDFIHSLSLHVHSVIKRAQNKHNLKNSLLTTLKTSVPFIYEISVQFGYKLENEFNINLTEDEIGYLSIHIGSIVKTSLNDKEQVNIFVIGSTYKEISLKIASFLKSKYTSRVNIIGISNNIPNSKLLTNADLVITTIMISALAIDKIVISPLLTESDKVLIDRSITKILKRKENETINQNMRSYFSDELFIYTKKSLNKKDAIIIMTDTLKNNGITDDKYTASVFERERISSTCFFDSFAVPHAIDFESKETKFCVLISDRGILWDDKNIHIVLMITVRPDDREIFEKIYTQIIEALCNNVKLLQISKSKTLNEFLSYISFPT